MNPYTKLLAAFDRLPSAARGTIRIALSLMAGLAAALVLSYVFYRVGLPSKPFIYVAF